MTDNFNPLVSIIIPVYNGSNYMREAIDSALAQTYKNIEIIVVNDGSTDNTEKIAKSYGDKIRYYKKENGGVATALNLAIKKSQGEYISWLSHDDVYYPDKIERQIGELSKLKAEERKNTILWSNFDLINENDEIISKLRYQELYPVSKLGHSLYPLLNGLIHGCTLLIPRHCFDDISFFDERLKATQDYDLWVEMFPRCNIVFMKEVFVKAHIHSAQNSKKILEREVELDQLWVKMVNNVSDEQKIEMNGSVLDFYINTYNYVKLTKRSLVVEKNLYMKIKRLLQKEFSDRAMVIANLATYPVREKLLQKSVESMLPQVDILNVYLNEYDEIPEFLNDPRINCVLSGNADGNLKDNGKFYFLDKVPDDSYYFTIDDDIIYPKDYVEKLISKLNKHDDEIVVGVHGIIFNKDCKSFTKDRVTYDYRKYLLYDKQVSVLGTGTIAFYKKYVRGLTLNDFAQTGMADLFFTKYCLKNDISLVAIERNNKWLQDCESEKKVETLWRKAQGNDKKQTNFIIKEKLWNIKNIFEIKDGKFSVVIPCYNLGSLLPQAIDSVFAQTLEDIEVIVVDDASSDKETQEVLKEWESKVHVIYLKRNSGVSVARNEGIKHAKSPYTLCLDADDTIEPTYLEKAKNVFDADEKVGIVSCGLQSFGGSDIHYIMKDKMNIKTALVNAPVHTASCFRKSAHDIGGRYDEYLRGYEDWDHWLRIMKHDWVVRVIPEYLFNYYVRAGSKVETSNDNAFELTSGIITNHKELYAEHFAYVIAEKQEELAKCNNARKRQQSHHLLKDRIVQFKKKFFPQKMI